MTDRGPVVVYRDRSAEEVRDISIVRLLDGRWTHPQSIHEDGWQIAGCPVNGPAVAARASAVAVAWFTAANDAPTVRLALSADGGESFDTPVIVAGQSTLGRVDVTLLESGQAVVSWLDSQGPDARIMLSRYSTAGAPIDTTEVATTIASRRAGFPSIEGVGNTVYVSWTAVSDTTAVKVARVRYDGAR